MGQTFSSNRAIESTNCPPTLQDDPLVSSGIQTHPTTHTSSSSSTSTPCSTPPEPKRKSKLLTRQSILKLVKPKEGAGSDQKGGNNRHSFRKSWRNSRRWSKSRAEAIPEPDVSTIIGETAPLPSDEIGAVEAEPAVFLSQPSTSSSTSTPSDSSPGRSPADPPVLPQPAPELMDDPLHGELTAPLEAPATTVCIVPPPSDVELTASATETRDRAIDHAEAEDRSAFESSMHESALRSPDVQSSSPSSPIDLPAGQQPAAQQQPGRQFPPPGTLVVVQGVVHTTDVPRSNPTEAISAPEPPQLTSSMPTESSSRPAASTTPPRSSTPVGSERTGARNRLSALLRRPASVIASRPPSTTGESVSTNVSPVIASLSHSEASTDTSASGASAPEENASNDNNDSTPEPETRLTTPIEPVPGTISSSSIEVLGTLLSVAAAATAASLLTGSSEPILSSGLAPPSSNPNNGALNSSPLLPSRPTSPTPTAGLGGITAAMDNQGTTITRSDRMRHAWDNFRERFGLRPANGSSNDVGLLTDNSTLRGRADDPREVMLAEMARAFNMGLGLNDPASGSSSSSTTPASPARDSNENPSTPGLPLLNGRTLPAEGSFERFLVDLQVDLRIALTQSPRASAAPVPSSAPELMFGPSESTAEGQAESAETVSASQDEPVIPTIVVDDSGTSPHAPTSLDDADDMPSLGSISDSSEEEDVAVALNDDDLFGHDQHNGQLNDPIPSNLLSNPMDDRGPDVVGPPFGDPHGPSLFGGQGSPESTIPGRINWWRLYRFPPIPLPRIPTTQAGGVPSQTEGAIATPTPAPTPAAASDTPSHAASISIEHQSLHSHSDVPRPDDGDVPVLESVYPPQSREAPGAPEPEASGSASGSSIAHGPETPARHNTVVPVIVVGLQSVNMNLPFPIPGVPPPTQDAHAHAQTDTALANESSAEQHEDPAGSNSDADSTGDAGQRRERPWRARAADALRNLRPGSGRRQSPPPQETPIEPTGSRTFLIYVIGGYYPPDHSIVTGGPNNFESFEALLELAELLGQAKPPTVSKEEIDKSGLKVIKPAQLEKCEKDGVIASSCTDRCLICLDDYDAEDDIRIMSCKHGFHKECVDRWLQTGRNNCPACRSKGVPTEGNGASPPTATMAT